MYICIHDENNSEKDCNIISLSINIWSFILIGFFVSNFIQDWTA